MEHPSDAKAAFDKATTAMAMVEIFAAKVTQLELRVEALEEKLRRFGECLATPRSKDSYLLIGEDNSIFHHPV